MAVVGSADIRARNSSLVLKLMWKKQQISRAEIARQTGLSRSTVSAIVGDLMDTGLLENRGSGDSRGGRRPILLGFEDDAFLLVGADIGATHVGVAVTNLRAQTRAWRHATLPVREDPQTTLDTLLRFIGECLDELDSTTDKVVGIGIAVPSPIDPEQPDRLSPIIHPRWTGVSLIDAVQNAFDVPIFLENDANLGALAEHWWGEGDGGDLAYIKVATGVGAGYMIGGHIYRGAGGFAGEIGHTTISTNGRSGELTSLIGTQALITRATALLDEHPSSLLATVDALSLHDIIEATQSGDALCRQLIDEAGTCLGIAIANLLNLLNPATVVLGGAITALDDLLLHPVRQAVRERTLWAAIAQSRLVTSTLGDRAIAIGAATLVLQEALDHHELFPSLRLLSTH